MREECLDDVKDRLWKHFEKRFDGAVTRGFPEWYKKRLADRTDWPQSWLRAADEAMRNAPPGPTALQHLQSDRNRLEPR